ncbi:CHASE2 domain-containing protein [Desulfoscipio gibsoniae]|uniref:Putative transmembrane sensor domain protein n=1 Tax=Desulfoscipio gibsoniae DSM 7213 TaxID=767817 RepID=R4KGA8_9FIRM|nr:adenylate/guanylate cyclase domain-containing protein [Desulfoscipio gibsoniae]AGL02253.1 putative transmembrane sensor domain protein [Desulfoscipio gibsoniae DSM 7213]
MFENTSSPTPGRTPGGSEKPTDSANMANKKIGRLKWPLALVLFTLVQLAVMAGLFNRVELAMYDAWFRLQGVRDPGERVVIVAMDEASIQKIGPLPWPRSTHARLLEALSEARVVGFDLVFDVPTDPTEDEALGIAIAEHGRVILASQFAFEREPNGEVAQVFQPPCPEIMAGVAGLGFVNMPTDPDQVVRRVTTVDVNTFEVPFPSLNLAVTMAALGMDHTQLEVSPRRLVFGEREIPLDEMNRAMPCFWGSQGAFKTYSCADVLNGVLSPDTFKDRIVLIGPTASAEKDNYPTPYTGSNMVLSGALPTPGVEIHASAVQSFLDGRWYREVSSVLNLAFLLLAGMLTVLVVSGRGPWVGLGGTLSVLLAVSGTSFGLWWYARLWLNVAAPVVLVFMTYAALTAADFIQAEMGRRRTRAMFSRYVSPDVVEELMESPAEVMLGGRRQSLTVMFCDIRGFTSYSENKPPEEVVSRLNEYLTAMTRVIFNHGGTLDKYLGDGLMAIFGAPVYYPDHVQRAIMAAVDIQKEINILNRKWVEQGQQPLNIGVGINSGSVLVGNVGSPERMDYTVIGEDVNLASRVEGLTKTFETLIVISERSKHMLDEADGNSVPELSYLGHAQVKGFTEPVGVYTI